VVSGTSAGREICRIATDPDAFEAFYRAHVGAVTRFVARRVDDPHLAADLIADVFVAAIDSATTYDPERGDPARWLYGVARHVIASERRRGAAELRVAGRVSGRALVDEDDLARLVERIDAQRAARHLYQAMSGLDAGDRELVELVGVDGVPVHEAASMLGISPGTARVRLHRARRRLRGLLSQSTPGGEAPPRHVEVKEASTR
jgi:RNA polymerase sigma-70 factor (ECF subfamily)